MFRLVHSIRDPCCRRAARGVTLRTAKRLQRCNLERSGFLLTSPIAIGKMRV